MPERDGWAAQPLFHQCASALLASFKVWNVATVGGNICQSFAAAAMVSLGVALDATALVWTPDGSDYRIAIKDLITGNGTNQLRPGEVLRAIDIPDYALRARTAFRQIARARLGRSGAVITGRVDLDGSAVFAITAATARPTVFRYSSLPAGRFTSEQVAAAPGYYTDPARGGRTGGARSSGVLMEQVRQELAA